MDEKQFIENYLKPSEDGLDKSFTHPLPPIAGLEKRGSFIVQGELEDTFSTNIIYKYESAQSKIRLIDVYKCSQHKKEGVFVRLVGTMSLVKSGYPFLFLDAAVTNISPLTQQREDTTTRVVIHVPQSSAAQQEIIFTDIKDKLDNEGIAYKQISIPHMPDFWGPIFLAESKKLDMQLIEDLRGLVSKGYEAIIEKTEADDAIDYAPVKQHMVFITSKNEGMLFTKMGLTVPIEAQAAFFSVMTAGVDNP